MTDMAYREDSAAPVATQGTVPAVRLRHVSKTFGSTTVLHDLDLEIAPGQIHALVGQNGSGKSTTVKLLSGFLRPDAGAEAELGGVRFQLGDSAAAHELGLRFVHQNLGLVDAMTVRESFMVGASSGLGRLRGRDEIERTVAGLASIGFGRIDPGARVADLSAPERTAVAIARALEHMTDVPLLVLDEPTASLPRKDARTLFTAMRRVAGRGTAILYISHHLDEVLQLSDRVSVLRDGVLVAQEDTPGLDHDRLVELMLGRRLVSELVAHDAVDEVDAEPVLEARGLAGAVLEGLDLSVRRGEVLGITGLVGSGSDEVAGMLSGRLPRRGELVVEDSVVSAGDPRAAIAAGVCTVPVDRAGHALITHGTVRENFTVSRLGDFWRRGRFDTRAEKRHVGEWGERLDVRPLAPERQMTELSGGNQQKVIVGRWLRVSPKVLVLEDFTQGVDIGSKADLHQWIERVSADGTCVILCSTDTNELARLASRVLVIRHGRVACTLTGAAITPTEIDRQQLSAQATGATSEHQTAPDL